MGKDMLNEDELLGVVGGKQDGSKKIEKNNPQKKKDFEKAWKSLKMDEKGVSGMKMAEVYDEWEMADFSSDATAFITANCC
ncbi:MAG: hypothetical protein K6E91_04075 [Butyrivibrio sp.]|nr:hypothetical protein [Butyrivibrio sp.]